ncbi:PTS glucitol/sorbitol transporter subunit IIA [Paracoccus pacificus]|uniref:PTS glucitol/sorbitol transporter subunit IIA n=1 Tax=Paracoccus pacificus TaxID=1463598 RepID=A0ABW4R4X3_9RHOB
MKTYLRTTITTVGPDVADLVEGGVLILFAEGVPDELAEVSVLHRLAEDVDPDAPVPGAEILVGDVSAVLTGIGDLAWNKIRDIGHVVINFNDSDTPQRPGEICASSVNTDALIAAIAAGNEIIIRN